MLAGEEVKRKRLLAWMVQLLLELGVEEWSVLAIR